MVCDGPAWSATRALLQARGVRTVFLECEMRRKRMIMRQAAIWGPKLVLGELKLSRGEEDVGRPGHHHQAGGATVEVYLPA